jgi:hypothetical protein
VRSTSRSTRLFAGTLAALTGLCLSAPPCFAAEAAAAPEVKMSLRVAVAKLATSDASAVVRSSQGAATSADAPSGVGRSFIHSPKGVAAILLLAGGVAWAIASRSKDAVHSPARN